MAVIETKFCLPLFFKRVLIIEAKKSLSLKSLRLGVSAVKMHNTINADWKTNDEVCDACEAKSGNKCSPNKNFIFNLRYDNSPPLEELEEALIIRPTFYISFYYSSTTISNKRNYFVSFVCCW